MRTDKNSGDIVPFQIKIFQLECANDGDIGPQEKRSWPRSDPGAPVCSIQSTVSTLIPVQISPEKMQDCS